MQKIFLFLFLFFLGMAFAQTEISITSISSENLQRQLAELRKLKSAPSLDAASKEQLQSLWEEANELNELNNRCAEISLNSSIDESCSDLYEVTLPKFEDDYLRLTGEIRINSVRIRSYLQDKRKLVDACVEAFPLKHLSVFDIVSVSNSKNYIEPLPGDNVELSYDFWVDVFDKRKISIIQKQFDIWYSSCRNAIFRQEDLEKSQWYHVDFAPLFDSKLSELLDGSSVFSIEKEFGNYYNSARLLLKFKKLRKGTYTINNRKIFDVQFAKGEEVLEISFNQEKIFLYAKEPKHFEGKIVLSENLEKGLVGNLNWYQNSPFVGGESGSFNAVEAKTEDVFPFNRLQLQLGFGIALGGADDNLREEYADIWEKNPEVADDSVYSLFFSGILLFKHYGRRFSLGFGGGIGVHSIHTSVQKNSYEFEDVAMRTAVAPVIQGELGCLPLDTSSIEIGFREKIVFDSKWTIFLSTIYLQGFDLISIELGWFYAKNCQNSVYLGFTVSLPPWRMMLGKDD